MGLFSGRAYAGGRERAYFRVGLIYGEGEGGAYFRIKICDIKKIVGFYLKRILQLQIFFVHTRIPHSRLALS